MKSVSEGFHRTFVPAAIAQRPRLQNGLAWALALVAVSIATYGMQSPSDAHYDFNLHYYAGEIERSGTYTDFDRLLDVMRPEGIAIPSEGVYGTPTLVALLYQPLSLLPRIGAEVVWGILCVVAITASMRVAVGRNSWPLFAILVTWTPAMLLSLHLGNVSAITYALIVAAYGLLRTGQQKGAGIALGVATAFKLYPGFLVFGLLVTKQFRAAAWAVGTCALLFTATVPLLGIDDIGPAIRAMQEVAGYVHPYRDNASIPGIIRRWSGSESLAGATSVGLTVVAVALIYRIRTLAPHIVLAAGSVAMLLVQSISWRHYFPLVILAVLAVQELTTNKRVLAVAVVVFAVLTELVNATYNYEVWAAGTTAVIYASGSLLLLSLVVMLGLRSPGTPPATVQQRTTADDEVGVPTPELTNGH